MAAQPHLFVEGPRGKIYVRPDLADPLLTLLQVYAAYAEAGYQRAKRAWRNSGKDPSFKGQVDYYLSVGKGIRWIMKTCHRGIDRGDLDTANDVIEDVLTDWLKSSPVAKLTAGGGEHVR